MNITFKLSSEEIKGKTDKQKIESVAAEIKKRVPDWDSHNIKSWGKVGTAQAADGYLKRGRKKVYYVLMLIDDIEGAEVQVKSDSEFELKPPVQTGSPVGGYQAVAEILGCTRNAVYDRWRRMQSPRSRTDFPRPVAYTLSGQPLWDLNEIREYAKLKKLGEYKEI